MKTYLFTNQKKIVKGIAGIDGNLEELTPSLFQGDVNLDYINKRTWDGQELKDYEEPKKIIPIPVFFNKLTDKELTDLVGSNEVEAKKLLIILDKSDNVDLEDEKIINAITNLTEIFTEERKNIILNL